jgi:cyclic-di-GMP phosphodiesterase TipF (flagellum assembly factor)
MLDVIVLIAMAVTAVAFAVGLILHSGIAQIPALIAAAALYMVMAASYLMVARSSRPEGAGGGDRLNELEEALEIIDKDLQRIDRVEDDVSRLDMLADRVERVDQLLAEYGVSDRAGGVGRSEQFTHDLEQMHAKIENLRADFESEASNQREKIAGDLRMLESMIKQLSREVIAVSAAEPGAITEKPVSQARTAAGFIADIETIEPEAPDEEEPIEIVAIEEEVVALDAEAIDEEYRAVAEKFVMPEEIAPVEEPKVEVEQPPAKVAKPRVEIEEPSIKKAESTARRDAPFAAAVAEAAVTSPADDAEMLDIMSQAIEAGRVDLYLQPTVTLPERRPRYFEALTRIRTKSDAIILPGSYLKVAESSGLIPLVDNVLLVKSVQTLRKLGSDSRIRGVFCNISIKTLLDPEFFPELVEFMEENSGLSESLVFEVTQPALLSLDEAELGALDTLAALGYGFSLDHVNDFDVEFASLRDRAFRFVKIDAKTFLQDLEAKGSRFSASEIKRALSDFDIKLIVEKVEDEAQVAKLLDHGVDLAQGNLFGKPKPMSPALFREIENADAA